MTQRMSKHLRTTRNIAGPHNPLKVHYLEGQGDLVSRLITPIIHIVNPFIPIINLLSKSPRPPK